LINPAPDDESIPFRQTFPQSLHSKRCLKLVNDIIFNLERSVQHNIFDARSKDVTRQRDRPWIGAAERRISEHGLVAEVDLVMHQALREDEDVVLLQHLRVQLVARVDKADIKLPRDHREHLRTPRVRVERVDPPGEILQQRRGDPQARQGREGFGVHPLDGEFRGRDKPRSVAEDGGREARALKTITMRSTTASAMRAAILPA
jgi:hypothetical protein